MIKKYRFATTLVLAVILFVISVACNQYYCSASSELRILQAEYNKTYIKLEETYNALNEEIEKANGLRKSLDDARNELDTANQTIADLKSSEYNMVYIGDFKLTHYCIESHEHICGNGDGLTATGTSITPGTTIAVDPRVIPLGTKVYIEFENASSKCLNGYYIAQDTGGAIKGYRVDVLVSYHSEAYKYGVGKCKIYIVE